MQDRYFDNRMFEHSFFTEQLLEELPPDEEVADLFHEAQRIYTADLPNLNESQLEHAVVEPILQLLGWDTLLPQFAHTIQGKLFKPDWALFPDQDSLLSYQKASSDEISQSISSVAVLVEAKDSKHSLDTKKADKGKNPYIQLLEYLSFARIGYGFLSNGLEWWLVDNTKITSEKKYLAVKLVDIVRDDDLEAFKVFYTLFRKENFCSRTTEEAAPIQKLSERDHQARLAVEDDLRKLVYGVDGYDSLFERIGAVIHDATNDQAGTTLDEVFENSLYFFFRLLFIAFFEDKYSEQLDRHPTYASFSLGKIYNEVKGHSYDYQAWNDLDSLFKTFAHGNPNLNFPLLNGGLFENDRARLLATPRLFDNKTLANILDGIFLYRPRNDAQGFLRRDFRALSVTHLGTIYEGLLEFEFRIAEEPWTYLEYETREKQARTLCSGYYDQYDASEIKGKKENIVTVERTYPKESLYLVSSQHSRKTSGSYYTPTSLSQPLVKRAIASRLEEVPSVLDLRILDNACGSGHLLVEALNHLARLTLPRLEGDPALEAELQEEIKKVNSTLATYAMQIEVDELAILKRLLLKRVIYGVDMQPFAVELAHLSLWIDTFVFGTPLSFIEHHVKVGNSLIGSTIQDFKAFFAPVGKGYNHALLVNDIGDRFSELSAVFAKLSKIHDTTPDDIQHSKQLYEQEILPCLRPLNRLLDLLSMRNMLLAEGKAKEARLLTGAGDLAQKVLDGSDPVLVDKIATYRRKYRFFHWEVEFPEAFSGKEKGFHIILGNPPWDKTKFQDPDFFSQYRSNYRSLTNRKKKEVQTNLLANAEVRARYEDGQTHARAVNEYYKQHYPHNAGAGDGNLFRFMVERNLGLLCKGGTLNYILPTGLLTEDGSENLRRHIFADHAITHFDGFENRDKLFSSVDSRYKFGLLQIRKGRVAPEQQVAQMRFYLTDPAALLSSEGCFDYALADITATSPEHMAYMEARGGRLDLDILKRCYTRFERLHSDWLDFRTELHATNDKSIFLEPPRKDGWLPLYKGAAIWQYDSLYAPPEYWLDPEQFDDYLLGKEINRLKADVYPSLPDPRGSQLQAVLDALGLSRKEELARFVVPDRNYFRLGFRDIARDTDERTLIAALVPKDIGAQNKLWLSIPKRYKLSGKRVQTTSMPVPRLLFAQAVFNSLVVDWILRFMTAITVNKTYLMRLPLPQPSDRELETDTVYAELVRNSLRLSLHYNREGFAELEETFDISDQDVPATPKQVDLLKIRNDCLVARLYDIQSHELEHILQSFPVLRRKRPGYVDMLLAQYPLVSQP